MNLQDKFKNLKSRVDAVNGNKIRLGERHAAAKTRLTKSIEASKELGHPDPRVLDDVKNKKIEEFNANLTQLEKETQEQEAILASIEA
jgi:septal ring factor EnvC (AmiA/AmiB activator)